MSATLSALRPHKHPLTLGAAGAFLLAAVVWGQAPPVADSPQASAEPKAPARAVEFTVDGALKRPPVVYRKWVSIGTPLSLHEGEAKAFHAVY